MIFGMKLPDEFVDVVRGLWDSWDDGALVADRQRGIFVDPSKVRDLNHKGRFFSVKGALNIERCPQGHPIIIQAGGSEPGQELSARVADLVFSPINGDLASAKAKYESLKARLPKYGRERKIWQFFRASCQSSETVPIKRVKSSGNCNSGSKRATQLYAQSSQSGLDATLQAMTWMVRSQNCPRPILGRASRRPCWIVRVVNT